VNAILEIGWWLMVAGFLTLLVGVALASRAARRPPAEFEPERPLRVRRGPYDQDEERG